MRIRSDKPRFEIGTKFTPRGKNKQEKTVVDILRTYNSKDECVGLEYLCEHEFLGQKIKSREIDTTIAMGLIKKGLEVPAV